MKKLMIIFLSFLIVLVTPFTSFSEELSQDELFPVDRVLMEWETNGYPDNVGYVIYDEAEDRYVIGLVDGTEADEKEIREEFSLSDKVVFDSSTYSYNELLELQEEIWDELAHIDGFYTIGTGWTSIDGEVTGFGDNGFEPRVVVTVDEIIYDEIVGVLSAEYGDLIFVETGEQPMPDMETSEISDSGNEANNLSIYLLLFTLLLLAVLVIGRRKFVAVKESAAGGNVTESGTLGRNQVISAVKESGVSPRDEVYGDILDKLKE